MGSEVASLIVFVTGFSMTIYMVWGLTKSLISNSKEKK